MKEEEKEIWIFLSHSNKDFAKVRLIRNYLEERSCRPLMFYLKCLSNDDEIDDLIKREIDCRTRFIICESSNSRSSKWVQSEIEYIKLNERSYDIIDLSRSEDAIKDKLDDIIKNTQIFLSYSRRDYDIGKAVYSHLFKYDLRCLSSVEDIPVNTSTPFQECIKQQLDLAKDFGFVVFFANRNSLSSHFVIFELQYSVERGANILILLLDEYAKEHYKEMFPQAQDIPRNDLLDRDQTSIRVRDLTIAKTKEDIIELVIEKIVDRGFSPWSIYTMAKNLLEGIDCEKDEEEANRLFKIIFKKAEALDSIGYPGGTLFLARCMANGYGTNKDLSGALCYYQEYIRICGSNVRIDKEIEQIKEEMASLV
ncbi:MAG: toll/interleukin-1 receptor domain-containing protein [Bacteroidales bacterium]|nr:toll/interleukin-1 receptor domain-containing protein [Bacteroidales bacterium]